MEKDAETLQCPNCQALNPLNNNFCQQCSTPLPKRYLWAVGDGHSVGIGEILADRYLALSKNVLLDTKPGELPQTPEVENLQAIKPYLRLFPYRLHVPSVYGVVMSASSNREILLLEKPPIAVGTDSKYVELFPSLTSAWREATSMRQLNWLWQIANLWQYMPSEGVASSLLDEELLRVEGSLVRLLELRHDQQKAPGLPELGEFWRSALLKTARPAIVEFVGQICSYMIGGEIHSAEQLINILDRGLAEVGREQTATIKIATKSDTGPSRQRNEDACYPASGSKVSKPPQQRALAIVCDGIGGHAGGNVASDLAIKTIQEQLQQLTTLPDDHIDAASLLLDLERAANVANDKISQRNDSENRSGRQRMGTTLVMGLAIAHEIYIAHVGDSRAYWIKPTGCYQVTLDDDVASREVRLGYALYREAVQQSASGSLVQALGMNPSSSLHPTAQRFILDEDCVFVLCSDGLSDFDRVEQHWETDVLPIVERKIDVGNATDKLVEIANTENGHDNVTVALIHVQVKYSEPKSPLGAALADISAIPTDTPRTSAAVTLQPSQNQKTQVIEDTQPKKGFNLPLGLIIPLLLAGVAALVAYLLTHGGLSFLANSQPKQPQPNNPAPSTNAPPASTGNDLDRGLQITLKNNAVLNKNPSSVEKEDVLVPQGSTLLVIDKKDSLLQLRLCPAPQNTSQKTYTPQASAATGEIPSLQPGEAGWISLEKIKPSIAQSKPADPNKQCPAAGTGATAPVKQSQRADEAAGTPATDSN